MGFILSEHKQGQIRLDNSIASDYFDQTKGELTLLAASFATYNGLRAKEFRKGQYCYGVHHEQEGRQITVSPGYFIGVDWLLEGKRYIQVEPKVNSKMAGYFSDQLAVEEENGTTAADIESRAKSEIANGLVQHVEINYLKMLLDAMADSTVAKECIDLVQIDWDAQRVLIPQEQDQLTPFLVVQFLQLLKQIVQKGLKKSYYKVEENLNSRVKGKILVGQQIKQNVLKNRFTKTYCSYQVFGEDSTENRFLKKVLRFCSSYVENNETIFKGNQAAIHHLIRYAQPAFEQVGTDIAERELRHVKHNPFFKEYKEAVRIGQFILKQFAYNITATTAKLVETPPFWIDMPRLFELYVYQKLLQANGHDTQKIRYQFSTYGNALDILIKDRDRSMIIDAKYKLHYQHGHVHEDMRQVAGYARLKKVRQELGMLDADDKHIDCLIIYPDLESGIDLDASKDQEFKLIAEDRKWRDGVSAIKPYYKIFKLGVLLPIVRAKDSF
ncbi:5-methylcytosine restriction system specificity protein McrC [Sphingobacterium bambusae]|uniref:Restriction endonuclease n=1 Tax=Sphingobacterium bambusae TaxID=662858 RepID=A0ABW6BML5_9SPHI|nr:hypothetical protein [Sphingobacterium bambusae]WPL47897.1 hypothetical protein SCB77_18265 [Sphingobacterium bambusae]